jgi:hypothetical protein
MKTSSHFTSALITAGAVGTALIALSSARFTAALPGEVIMGVTASLALIGLAIYDYSRRVQPLSLPGRVLRPTLPQSVAPRATAYGIKHAGKERIAA